MIYIDIINNVFYMLGMNKSDCPQYLNLNGYPLHQPVWKTFHQSAGVKAGMLCSVFAVAGELMGSAPNNAIVVASVVMPLVLAHVFQIGETTILDSIFGTNQMRFPFLGDKKLAVATQPLDVRTTDSNIMNAKRARYTGLGLLGVTACSVAALFLGAAPKPTGAEAISLSEAITDLGLIGEIVAPAAATLWSCASRFHKVVTGEYAIVDAPPKKKPEEVTSPSAVFNPGLSYL